jgi:hypothetical protein
MSEDPGRRDPGDASEDPLCALLTSESPEDSLVLLPAAVRRADELAGQLRESVQLRGGSSDPLLVELVAAMKPALTAHERFVSTWSETTTLGMISQAALDEDVCALTRTWAELIGVVLAHAEAPTRD